MVYDLGYVIIQNFLFLYFIKENIGSLLVDSRLIYMDRQKFFCFFFEG